MIGALLAVTALVAPAAAGAQSTLPPRAEVEPNNSLAAPDPVPVPSDTAIRGSISPAGDRDFFRVIVSQEAEVRFETFVPDRPQCEQPPDEPDFRPVTNDTVLRLYDSSGTVIAINDDVDGTVCSRIVRNLEPGVYYIEVLEFVDAFGPFPPPNDDLPPRAIPAYTLEIDFTEELPPRVAQHFKGFRAVGGPASRELVTLIDQFGEQRVRVGAVRQLFTPVEKRRTGRDPEPIQRPEEHLKCYRITGPSAARAVRVENQFSESTQLQVGEPTDLCTPASKVLAGEAGPPPADLNHYKCYAVSGGASVAENVDLVDQFGRERVRVQRASRLCNPVEKRRAGRDPEPPPHPSEHLVCYQMRELGDPFAPRTVFTNDQFGAEPLRIDQPSRLCVPSEKLEVGGV